MRCDTSRFDQYAQVIAQFGDTRRGSGGLVFRCLFPERHAHGDRTPSGWLWIGNQGQLLAGCWGCRAKTAEYARLIGLPLSQFWPEDQRQPQKGKTMSPDLVFRKTAEYHYRNIDGTLAATKVREQNAKGSKKFHWIRPLPENLRFPTGVPDGVPATLCGYDCMEKGWFVPKKRAAEGWDFWNCDMDRNREKLPGAVEVPAPHIFLYHACDVAMAKPELPVVVVEGEKDVDTLMSIGLIATCPPHGANKWHADASKTLLGRRVLVIPDNDQPGIQHAERVVGSLIMHGAKEVRVMMPGECGYNPPENGGDVTDWLMQCVPSGEKKERLRLFSEVAKKLVKFQMS